MLEKRVMIRRRLRVDFDVRLCWEDVRGCHSVLHYEDRWLILMTGR